MNRIKYYMMALIALLAFSGCSDDDDPEQTNTRTVLVYLAADNSLSSYGSDSMDAIIKGSTVENLKGGKMLVYYDPKNDVPMLYEISENSKGVVVKNAVKTYEEQNSVDVSVMQGVINEVMTDYPADSYGLVLWSHATAWFPSDYTNYLRSFGQDGSHYMELSELATALSPYHFDFILFDCCYMASVEVMYALKDCADYIIASPTEILAEGFPYAEIVGDMFDEEADVEDMCEAFYQSYATQTGLYQSATVALVKTSEMDALAAATQSILAGKQDSVLNLDVSGLQKLDYLSGSYHLLYDFDDYISRMATADQLTTFRQALNKAVVYKAATANATYGYNNGAQIAMKSFCGLSSYVLQSAYPSLNSWYGDLAWSQAVYQ